MNLKKKKPTQNDLGSSKNEQFRLIKVEVKKN